MITDKCNRKRHFLALNHRIYERLIFCPNNQEAEAEAEGLVVHMVRLGNKVISAQIYLHIFMISPSGTQHQPHLTKNKCLFSPVEPQRNRDQSDSV